MELLQILFWGFAVFALVQFSRIFAQMAKSLNEISVVLQEMLKDSRSGK